VIQNNLLINGPVVEKVTITDSPRSKVAERRRSTGIGVLAAQGERWDLIVDSSSTST
jgi:hypothetical protein